MSDEIDWIPVLAWSACVSFQVGTAICEGLEWTLNLWRNGVRSKNCDHCRLIKGETRNGWQFVVPEQLYDEEGTRFTYFTYSQLRRKAIGENRPSMIYGYNFSILRYAAENRSVLQYRRFSLISPKVNATFFKIIYDSYQWWPRWCFRYLGHHSVAGVFRKSIDGTPTGTHRILIGDALTRRQPRWFDIQAPAETAKAIAVYYDKVPGDRLMVLFREKLPTPQVDADMDEDFVAWRFEFHVASYEIERQTGDGQQKPLPAVSWETISIPGGARNAASAYVLGDEAVLMVLYDNTDSEAVENHLCVTFDNEKLWRVETYPEWLGSMQKTPVGARVMDAVNSLSKLRNLGRDSGSISLLKDLYRLNPHTSDGVVFYGSSRPASILRRWCKPPPLKFLAAESLVRAHFEP